MGTGDLVESKFKKERINLSRQNTTLAVRLSVTGEQGQEMSVSGTGSLTVANKQYEPVALQGHLTRLGLRSGLAMHGVVRGALRDGTHLTITINYMPEGRKTLMVAFLGAVNIQSGILVFGQSFSEALIDIPDAIEKGHLEQYGSVATTPLPGADEPSAQSCGDPLRFNYGIPPHPTTSDPVGRRWQQFVDNCGWTLGAVMLWAPDNVTRGLSLQYGARIWSDSYGATQVFTRKHGAIRNVGVYIAYLRLTMSSEFGNSGATSPPWGSTGTYITVPLAKLASFAGCEFCWVIPNIQIPMKVTTASLQDNLGGRYNQFVVQWSTSFSFNNADTDYISSASPYTDEKGFGIMSPFARQTQTSGIVFLPITVHGEIFYRGTSPLGLVTFPAVGEDFTWYQTNLP